MTVRRGISKRSHEKIGDCEQFICVAGFERSGVGEEGENGAGIGTEGIHFLAPATSQVAQARFEI